MRERFSSIVTCRILLRERGPHISFVLPLCIHHDIQGCWCANLSPWNGNFGHHVSFPSSEKVDLVCTVDPSASIVRDKTEVRVILENESIVRRKWKGMGEAPVLAQDGPFCGGIEINEEICSFRGRFPVGSIPSNVKIGCVPCHVQIDVASRHQFISVPIGQITIHCDA